MNIDKSQIVELLKSRGDMDTAAQADKSLPATVDTETDKGLLDRFGVDISDLTGKLGGLRKLGG